MKLSCCPSVTLRTRAGSENPLNYVRVPLDHKQTRLKGRVALRPEIDLASFRCRAVIDWLDLSIRTGRPTQGQWINTWLEAEHGINVLATAIGGRTTTDFTLRFQEPDFAVVIKALATLDGLCGLEGPAKIVKAEVSVDFCPRVAGDDWQRWLLVAVLTRHLWPSRDLTAAKRDLPRFVWGSGSENTAFFLPQKPDEEVDPEKFMFNGNDRSPFVDATTYFGAEESSPSWRFMDKILDRQNRERRTWVTLPDNQKRVRVEVTLDERSLREAGIVHLEDLGTGALTRFQGRHFRFVLPTFENLDRCRPGRRRSLATYIQREREQKFLTTGVVGLDAMNRQWTKVRAEHRRTMLKRGIDVPRHRAGGGKMGDFVAYDEVNGKMAMALEKLTERCRKQLSALTL